MDARILRIGLLGSLLAMALAAGPVRAADTGSPVTLELANVPLAKVIQLLCTSAGVEIVFDDPEGKLPDRVVAFISIRDKPLEKALDLVCRSARVYYQKDADGVYHLSPTPF